MNFVKITDDIVYLSAINNWVKLDTDNINGEDAINEFLDIDSDKKIIDFISRYGWLGVSLRKEMVSFYKKHPEVAKKVNFNISNKTLKSKIPVCRTSDFYQEVATFKNTVDAINKFNHIDEVSSHEDRYYIEEDYDTAISTINQYVKSISMKLKFDYIKNETISFFETKNILEFMYITLFYSATGKKKIEFCHYCKKIFFSSNPIQKYCSEKCTHKQTQKTDNDNVKKNPIRNLRKKGIAHIDYMLYQKKKYSASETGRQIEVFKYKWSLEANATDDIGTLCEKFDNLCREFCDCKKCQEGYSKHIYKTI